MDFSLPVDVEALRSRFVGFVRQRVLPLENDPATFDDHENIRLDLLEALRAEARAEGLWCPQVPTPLGGMGLSRVAMAACYEAMNESIFGPAVFNAAAPDDGNLMLLAAVATPEQQERWLRPMVDGQVRSAFAMTEPHPGGGSDPTMIATRAERIGEGWRITGRKWFITGAGEASHFIVIARTGQSPRAGLSAFLFHRDQPGWRIERRIPIMGPEEHGGHCELVFDDLYVPQEAMLLGEGDGLRLAQIRLGPARLTHCMRWLGLSHRCLTLAQDYVQRRQGFGHLLADRESVQIALGDIAGRLQTGRLLVMRAAWELDQGRRAQAEISMAKLHVARLLHDAADVAIQLNGARGYSKDTVLEWIYRYARQARIVDGADEVHRTLVYRAACEPRFWQWPTG